MNPVARVILNVKRKDGWQAAYVPRLPPGRVRAPIDAFRPDVVWQRYVYIRGRDLAHQNRA